MLRRTLAFCSKPWPTLVLVAAAAATAGALELVFGLHNPAALVGFGGVAGLFYLQRHPIAELGKVAGPYWWPAALIIGLAYAIMMNDQVRDMLEAAAPEGPGADGSAGLTNAFWPLLVASGIFGFTAWTFLRLASEFDHYRPEDQPAWRNILRLQTARAAGVVLPLVIAGRYLQLGWAASGGVRHDPYVAESVAFGALALGLFAVFWLRRVVFDGEGLLRALVGYAPVVKTQRTFTRKAPLIWISVLLGAHFVVGALVMSPAPLRYDAAAFLGAPALVLFASAGFLGIGWLLFTFLPYRFSWRAVPAFFVLWTLIASAWNDNHAVRVIKEAVPEAQQHTTRAEDFARAWLAERGPLMESCRFWPVYVVAAEGGGVRAAYWTAGVLGRLEEETRGLASECGAFADHVFVISGVSGGSLGAAAFAAAIKDDWDRPAADGDAERNPRAVAAAFLRHDFLSPTVASLLYPDALVRLWPFDGHETVRADRARWMEGAWETRWTDASDGGASFSTDYRALWSGGRMRALLDLQPAPAMSAQERRTRRPEPPILAMNTTSVQTGAKWVLGPVRFDSEESHLRRCESGVFEDLGVGPISLATAAHLSARFTYISPAGRVDTAEACAEPSPEGAPAGPPIEFMRFVDGGYFEDSGAATAFEAVAALRSVLIEECPTLDAKPFCRAAIVPVAITAEPAPLGDEPPELAPEMRSPINAVFAARGARGVAARRLFSVSGDRVSPTGGAIMSRAFEPRDQGEQMKGEAVRAGAERPDFRIYIDIRLPRQWGGACDGGATSQEAFTTPYAACPSRDAREPSRLLPLGWTLSQWAVRRMDDAVAAQFAPTGCAAAALALIEGDAAADAMLRGEGSLSDGRCEGVRWTEPTAQVAAR